MCSVKRAAPRYDMSTTETLHSPDDEQFGFTGRRLFPPGIEVRAEPLHQNTIVNGYLP